MRIVAGEFGGRRIKPPPLPARATEERVREAWFNIVGSEVPAADVLDLFAGSGALGLEALSRGAKHVTFVERARKSLKLLEANITALRVEDRSSVVAGDVFTFLKGLDSVADIAFADAPFASEHAMNLVDAFRARPFARILGVEHANTIAVPGDDHRRYGDVALTFCYR